MEREESTGGRGGERVVEKERAREKGRVRESRRESVRAGEIE